MKSISKSKLAFEHGPMNIRINIIGQHVKFYVMIISTGGKMYDMV